MGAGPAAPQAERATRWGESIPALVGYTVIPVLVALVGIIAARAMRDIGSEYDSLANETLPAVEALQELRAAALRIVASTSEHGFIRAESIAAAAGDGLEKTVEREPGEKAGSEAEETLISHAVRRYNVAMSALRTVHAASATAEWPEIDAIVEAGALLIGQGAYIVELKNEGVAGRAILEQKETFEEDEVEFLAKIAAALAYQRAVLQERQNLVSRLILEGTVKTMVLSLVLALAAIGATQVATKRLTRTNKRLRAARDSAVDARREATQANHAKTVFLANMSHELRTPLHGILAFSEFGLDPDQPASPAEVEGYFERIQTCGHTLLHLLNDLLDLATFESGKAVFDLQPHDVGESLRAAADRLGAVLGEREIDIRLRAPAGSLMAPIDPARMAQVFDNVLGNAVRFSPDGGTIDVSLERSGELLGIEVRDRGPGIPDEEVELVFDKFVQSSRTASGAGGTGLGLAICRQILEAHHGTISARNCRGGGAIFSLQLPLLPVSRDGEANDGAAA